MENKIITVLIDNENTDLVHYVFINEQEEEEFVDNTPEWDINAFIWCGVNIEDCKKLTFVYREDVKKVQKVFPKFESKITFREYEEAIEKLPSYYKRKYFNWIDKNEFYTHYINTREFINWDVSDSFKRIAEIPIKELKNIK